MKYDMDGKGYWDAKPMKQQLECTAKAIDFPMPSYVHPVDLEGLIKIGVRFPALEYKFKHGLL